jgi:hypothetical protein
MSVLGHMECPITDPPHPRNNLALRIWKHVVLGIVQLPRKSNSLSLAALAFLSVFPAAFAGAADQFGNDYSKIEILSATYGSGGKQADVKAKVIDFLVTNPRKLVVTPRYLGIDPAPYSNKELKVTHLYKGKERVYRWGENEFAYSITLCLPITKEELEEWIVDTRWLKASGEVVIFKVGVFGVQNSELEPMPNAASGTWSVSSGRKLRMTWSRTSMTVECNLPWDCSQFTEVGGSKHSFKRLPSLSQLPSIGQPEISTTSSEPQTPTPQANTPVVVAPSQTASSPPQTTGTPPAVTTSQSGGIMLDRGWESPMQGGSSKMEELGRLLSPFAKPAPTMNPFPTLEIYSGVTYLMPYEAAKKVLGLNQKVIPKNKMACPGFPKDSFSHYAFDGVFEGHFNKLYLVVDKADQVVAVQLVAESPNRDLVQSVYREPEWVTYNFVNVRSKASSTVWVDHEVRFFEPAFAGSNKWRELRADQTGFMPSSQVNLIRIDSLLMNPGKRGSTGRQHDWKALEAVRLYLPKPMIELVLHCIQGAQR